jgi:hypothetical protein
MRKKRYLIGATGLAVSALAVSIAIAAPATQSIESELGGKTTPKFHKKKFKKTVIEVTTETSDAANPAGIPPKATKAVIKFDKKNVKFDPKAAPTCDPNVIENTSTQAALAACGDALVGKGSAVASLPLGAGTRQDFDAVVNAFNRADAKGILLHSRVEALGTTVVLKGVLKGSTLSVDVPPLGGGVGAIAKFNTKVKKGKYVQGRCKNKKIKTTSTFTFSDAPTATAKDTQKCKQKKK